ncbi:MAG TPA: hypothetical protein VHT27_03870 [Solirubrobacteraceae bacterium]|jgi:uncharacterized glyoxalase superfamily protein PhnB|nr:hypothetical protein [Solirubrobacteraceae bacterium]
MTSIESVTLEVPDPPAAKVFLSAAFDLDGSRIGVRPAAGETSGFRGFSLSLVVAQPANADALFGAALAAGAEPVKPVRKSLWGYGGVLRAPDGAIWKVATSRRKNAAPASREIEQIVLLLGVSDVLASKRFYTDQGLEVGRSFGRKYVEFAGSPSAVKLALYARRALAKDVGVAPEGSGSHRIALVGGGEPFTDPDGFAWEPAQARAGERATVRV